MVRQAYINRLILGRSAFEPPNWHDRDGQQGEYVVGGPPRRRTQGFRPGEVYVQQFGLRGQAENRASRWLARRSRRAQNDVLSTIGVCVCVDENGNIKSNSNPASHKADGEKQLALANIQENASGFQAGIADYMLHEVTTEWAANLRRRIQTFSYYHNTPISSIVGMECTRLGLFTFLLAGELPALLFHLVNFIAEGAALYFGLSMQSLFKANDGGRSIWILKQILKGISFCAVATPLQFVSSLQRLGLVESWPPLPVIHRISLAAILLPPRPTTWTGASALAFAGSLGQTPLAAWLGLTIISGLVEKSLSSYLEVAILRPDNPDSESYKLEALDGILIEAPVLRLPKFQGSFFEKISKDIKVIVEEVTNASHSVKILLRRGFRSARRLLLPSGGEERNPTVTFVQDSSAETLDKPTEVGLPDQLSTGIQEDAIPVAPTATPSLPESPEDSESPDLSDVEPSIVTVRTRIGSTSTFQMDLEVDVPMQHRSASTLTPTITGSSRITALSEPSAAKVAPKPHHRVTALTLHPSTTLNVHITRLLTSAICIPLESYYLRSLARAFLASKGPDSSWLTKSVYPPFGLGLGRTGWGRLGNYSMQIILCFGLEALFGLGAWRTCCAWPLWAGKKWYSWGKL